MWISSSGLCPDRRIRFLARSAILTGSTISIMGATKRICEMIIQTYKNHSQTEYVAVRFGNVIGSNGSVIPLFNWSHP